MTTPAPTTTIQQQPQIGGPQPPPGAPPGGIWVQENYCGGVSWLIGIFGCVCIACCPVDSRTVYTVQGSKYNMMGAKIL
ncbi:unnamed protein product [Hapterophycus canaliculatus]